jgi:hypothetical protein
VPIETRCPNQNLLGVVYLSGSFQVQPVVEADGRASGVKRVCPSQPVQVLWELANIRRSPDLIQFVRRPSGS